MGRQTGRVSGVSSTQGTSIVIPGGGSGQISVKDEGSVISDAVTILDFVGADVRVLGSAGASEVQIYIPPPAFDSHWNSNDGSNGNQAVSESISRTTARISQPTSEGNPFNTGGTANTDAPASINSSATFTTPSTTTGWGGNSNMAVTFFSADGTTVLDSYTTPAITGNGTNTSSSGKIVVTISSYAADTTRFKAKASVAVNVSGVFSDNSLQGGRYNVRCVMTTDSTSDGTGPYTFTQTAVFYDTNPSTPSIAGSTTIAETGGSVVTKHLSGIEYYTTGSDFTVAVTTINNLNANTAKASANLVVAAPNYGISSLSQSPFGTGSGNFSGWTIAFDNTNANYSNTAFAISSSNFRFRGTNAVATATPADPWASGSTATSSASAILVDTFGTTSSDLVEDFDDENRRQDSGYNSGNTSGNWTSTASLSAGEAAVFGGELIVPSAATLTSGASNADYSLYKPDAGGANPNYSALGTPANYFRTIVDSTGLNRSSFTLTLTGTFVSNATDDLLNDRLQIIISRRASANGGFSGPTNTNLLEVHGPNYNFASFDDGVTNGNIREASSSGGTVNCTFGGKTCETGFFMNIRINNTTIKIDRIAVTFF